MGIFGEDFFKILELPKEVDSSNSIEVDSSAG